MKRVLFIIAALGVSVCCHAQTDTLSLLKTKAISYTMHELIKPESYKSIGWSEIFHQKNGYKLMNVFNARGRYGKVNKLLYTFKFDDSLELISVNMDPLEKQLEEIRLEQRKAQAEIKRIEHTRDAKIKALSSQ